MRAEKVSGIDSFRAAVASAMAEGKRVIGTYHAEFIDKDGNRVWEDVAENVVTQAGIDLMLDSFITGSGFTQTGPYMGLISSVGWTNLATTISSLASYSPTTGIAAINTAAAHGLLPGDSVTIASAAGTGTDYAAVNGTFTCQASTAASVLYIFVGYGLTISTLTGGNVTTTSGTRIGDTMASHANWTEAGSTNAPTYTYGGSGVRGTPTWSAASGGTKQTSAAVSFAITSNGSVEGCFLALGSGAVNTFMSTAGTLFSAGAFAGGAQAVSGGGTLNVSYSLSIL